MDSSSFEGLELDPSKCSKLTMEEKREFVYEVAKRNQGASEMLQNWSRQEILQILCAEIGKDRKYTGLTKLKIIENLLKIVAEKSSQENETENSPVTESSSDGQRASKRRRKNENPTRVMVSETEVLTDRVESEPPIFTLCKNSACKAKLSPKDKFCKRCSCCICRKYDDNKDPSLWLTCSSDPPYEGESCGMSSHLDCALRNGKTGIAKGELEGSFVCVSCGKVNDLLGCWRKQLITAKETRRVDILCYRISLSQKLLSGTKRYQKLYEIVDEAVNKLEADVGPLTGLPVKKARGIVNRLSCGPEVQRLCALAVESLDSILSEAACPSSDHFVQGQSSGAFDSDLMASNIIHIEDLKSPSVKVISFKGSCQSISGYTFWHRKAEAKGYAEEPTCELIAPFSSYVLSGLSPATKYIIKVICFKNAKELGTFEVQFQTRCAESDQVPESSRRAVERSESPTTNSSSLSNPSSMEDENINIALSEKEKINDPMKSFGNGEKNNAENTDIPEEETIRDTSNDNESNTHSLTGNQCGAEIPITPCKVENIKDKLTSSGRGKPSKKDFNNGSEKEMDPQDGSSSKKRSEKDRDNEENLGNDNSDFEYYVKVIRWLECEGLIDASFRQKFLTWYSLRATSQEVRVVKVFVDTLIDDPVSLAGQLSDAFSEIISSKRSLTMVPLGLCMKLWH